MSPRKTAPARPAQARPGWGERAAKVLAAAKIAVQDNVSIQTIVGLVFVTSYGRILDFVTVAGYTGWESFTVSGIPDLGYVIGAAEKQRYRRLYGKAPKKQRRVLAALQIGSIVIELGCNLLDATPAARQFMATVAPYAVSALAPLMLIVAVYLLELRNRVPAPAPAADPAAGNVPEQKAADDGNGAGNGGNGPEEAPPGNAGNGAGKARRGPAGPRPALPAARLLPGVAATAELLWVKRVAAAVTARDEFAALNPGLGRGINKGELRKVFGCRNTLAGELHDEAMQAPRPAVPRDGQPASPGTGERPAQAASDGVAQ